MALEVFRVESSFGPIIAWDEVIDDLERALDGRLALAGPARRAGPALRPAAARRPPSASRHRGALRRRRVAATPRSSRSTRPTPSGVLYRITRALADLDLDIVSAKVQTLGPLVVDSFYVRDHDGRKITDPPVLAEIERAVLHAVDDR